MTIRTTPIIYWTQVTQIIFTKIYLKQYLLSLEKRHDYMIRSLGFCRMNPIFSIALTGLTAATRRLAVSGANVANVDTTGPLPNAANGAGGTPAPFQPLQVTQQPLS